MTKREKVIELRKKGKKYKEISSELKVSTADISKILKEEGMHYYKVSDDIYESVIRLAVMGYSSVEIAKEVGLAYGTVRNYLSKQKVSTCESRVNIVKKVLSLSETMSSSEIAEKLNLNADTVRRTRWRYGIDYDESYYRKKRAIEMSKSGLSIDEIANKLNVKYDTVVRYFK